MKNCTLLLVLLLGLSAKAQEQEKSIAFKNELCFETGLWNRGLAGASYSRNFAVNRQGFWSATASAGFGIAWTRMNTYGGLNISYNIGKNGLFFVAGIEGKYFSVRRDEFTILSTPDITDYKGVTAAPALGFKLHRNKFVFEYRASVLPIFEDRELSKTLPSIGIKFGYLF